MIKLSVIDSVDKDKKGVFTFSKNLIYIGKDYGCDLYIDDQDLHFNHIFIEIVDSKLLCHLGKLTDYILINKKRTTGHKYIQAGDTLTLKNTTLQIDSFMLSKAKDYKTTLNDLTEAIINTDKDLLKILKEVQKSQSI